MRSRNRRAPVINQRHSSRVTREKQLLSRAYMTRPSEGVSRYARARACVHVASARTIREIAQGSLIPVDCALFVAVVQAAAKKSNLTVDPTVDSCLLFPFPPPLFLLTCLPTYFASVEFFLIELGTHRLRMRRK